MAKKDYSIFSHSEIRAILRWLTARKYNSWLKLYDEEGEEICEYYGRFTVVDEQIADSRVIGFTCTFTSCYPYAFSPIRDVRQTFVGSETIVIENDSDVLDDVIRPYMTIKPLNEDISLLTIKNAETNKVSYIKFISKEETLTVDNENKLIYSDNDLRIIGGDFYGRLDHNTHYPAWIELIPGDNKLIFNTNSSTAKVEYTIQYRYPIKIGGTF